MRNLADGEYYWVGEYQYPDESYGLVSTLFPYLVTRCYQEDLQMFHAIRQELGQGQRPFSGNWRPAEDGQWKTPWRSRGERGGLGAGVVDVWVSNTGIHKDT